MNVRVFQSGKCSNACVSCQRAAALRGKTCDSHSACPGYGSSDTCPPLIVLAVHECLNAALETTQPALTLLRTAHA